MWRKFTERARKAVYEAQAEAQDLARTDVATEHLLLGLLGDPESSAGRILLTMNMLAPDLRELILKNALKGDASKPGEMVLSPEGKRVVELAYEEAQALGNDFIGTEHLLIGLAREENGMAGRLLRGSGFDLVEARLAARETQELIGRNIKHANVVIALMHNMKWILLAAVLLGIAFILLRDAF